MHGGAAQNTSYLPRADITLYRKNRFVRGFNATENTDAARGIALKAARDAAVSGDLLQLSPVEYLVNQATMGANSALMLPDGVDLAGAGMETTRVYTTDLDELFYVTGASLVRDCHFHATTSSNIEAMLVQGTGALNGRNLWIDGTGNNGANALWLNPGGGTPECDLTNCKISNGVTLYGNCRFYNCLIADAGRITPTILMNDGASVKFYGGEMTNAGANNASLVDADGTGTYSLEFHGSRLALTGGTGILFDANGFNHTLTSLLNGCEMIVPAGGTGIDVGGTIGTTVVSVVGGRITGGGNQLVRASQTLNVSNLQYDPAKTSGTITHPGGSPIFHLTAAQISALPSGHGLRAVFDTTANKLQAWNGSAFENVH